MADLQDKLDSDSSLDNKPKNTWQNIRDYLGGCIKPENARLYGTFQERAALNITQFHKIQGSLLIRMGIVYPFASYVVDRLGLPKDCSSDVFGMAINYHTWAAGYLAYLTEIQFGLSKYPIEFITKLVR